MTNAIISYKTAYIGLGSNKGDREENIASAQRLLFNKSQTRLLKSSGLYESSPIGPRQENFLNGAIKINTALTAQALLTRLKSIEKILKRKKTVKWGPRTIDLDILFYGEESIRTPRLQIPHPEFAKRKFVLKPLCEIAPRYVPPGFNKNIKQLLSALRDPKQKVIALSNFAKIRGK